MRRWLTGLLLAGVLLPPQARAADTLVVAPEASHVDITVNFAGTDLKAFGALDGSGDLVLKISGPPQTVTLSREAKRGPFWLEASKVEVAEAPSLLYLYATRPIAGILAPAERERYGLTLEAVPLHIEPPRPDAAAQRWREAFFRLKEKAGSYVEDVHAIRVIGNRLFITHIPLPGELETGTYTIETLLVKSRAVTARSVAHFEVRQVGIERWVWIAAHKTPWLFGGAFTLSMMALGLLLNALTFRLR